MKTITNTEANRKIGTGGGVDMVGQIMVGGGDSQPLAVEDTLVDCVTTINRLFADDEPVTVDDIREYPSNTSELTYWTIIAD